MPRSANIVQSVQITVSVTEPIRDLLEELTGSGLYGKNAAETANDLLKRCLQEKVESGELARPSPPPET